MNKFRFTLKLVIIRVDEFQKFVNHPAGALILVQAQYTLEEFHHLLFVLVPHCRARINPRYVIAVLHGGRRGAGVRLLVDCLVVAVTFFLFNFSQILNRIKKKQPKVH